MLEHWKVHWGSCTTQEAHVLFEPPADDASPERSAFLRGPFSPYANTLTADFPLRPATWTAQQAVGLAGLITEPCYWTPRMPFLYQLHLAVPGTPSTTIVSTGPKRFAARGPHLFLEQKRIVLRGIQTEVTSEAEMSAARDAEVAILVADPPQQTCERASRIGVPLIVDLTSAGKSIGEKLDWYAWFPAVMVVVLNRSQLAALKNLPYRNRPLLVALHLRTDDSVVENLAERCDLLLVEVSKNTLPAWIDDSGFPVIAFAPQPTVEIATARQACDRLQAALAPRYDLAGYFV